MFHNQTLFRNHKDLVVISAIALVGALLAIAGIQLGAWFAIFGILMVLVLPGYLFSQLLLPRLPFEERLLVSLGLSIVIVGFSGLLLNLSPLGLTPVTWAVWLALVILTGVILLWRRRGAGNAYPSTFTRPKIAWPVVLSAVVTLALIGVALGIAQAGSDQLTAPLTGLWASYDARHPEVLNIGVQNEEKAPLTYTIIIQQNGAKVDEFAGVVLEPGATFNGMYTFAQRPGQPVTILLYKADQPGKVYRQVIIDYTQGAKTIPAAATPAAAGK